MEIKIQLAERDIGTTAKVTEHTGMWWWKKETVTTYICYAADPINGAAWVDMKSGGTPSACVESKINYAARNAVQLAAAETIAQFIKARRAAQ